MAHNLTGVTNDTTATSDLDGLEVRARVVKAHESRDENQLSLEVGEIVLVLEQDDSGWWGGHKEGDDRTAWFPGTCVVVIQEQPDSPRVESGREVAAPAPESPRRRVDRQAQPTTAAATVALAPHDQQADPHNLELEQWKLEVYTLRERYQNARDQLMRSDEYNKELKAELQSCRDDARSDRARADERERRLRDSLQECQLEVKRLEQDLRLERDNQAQRETASRARLQELEARNRELEEARRLQELRLAEAEPRPRRRLFDSRGSRMDSRTDWASPVPSESLAPSPAASPVQSQPLVPPLCGGAKRFPAQRPASLGPAGRGYSAGHAQSNKQDLARGLLCASRSVGDLSPKRDLEVADREASVASKIASIEQRMSGRATPGRSPSPARSLAPAANRPPVGLRPEPTPAGPHWSPAVPAPLDDEREELQVVLGMSPLNHRGRRTSQASSHCPGSSTKQGCDQANPRESMIPEVPVKERIHTFSSYGASYGGS